MKVGINDKFTILKNFSSWLPVVSFALIIYWIFLFIAAIWLFEKKIGFPADAAKLWAGVISLIVIFLGILFFTNRLLKKLSSYYLSIENGSIRVSGTSGWRKIDANIPIDSVVAVFVGFNPNIVERNSGVGVVDDIVESRLSIFLANGSSVKLDYATKAFNRISLIDFIIFLKSNAIETNLNDKYY